MENSKKERAARIIAALLAEKGLRCQVFKNRISAGDRAGIMRGVFEVGDARESPGGVAVEISGEDFPSPVREVLLEDGLGGYLWTGKFFAVLSGAFERARGSGS